MKYPVSLIASSIAHLALLLLLSSNVSFKILKTPPVPLEARLVVKKQKDKDLLPRKPKMPLPPQVSETKVTKKETAEETQKKPADTLIPIAPQVKEKPVKKTKDYTQALSSLSQSFAKELELAPQEPEGELVPDSTYFDQVYSLIKESFIIPPHLNGPRGQNLRAVIRIFLASDGSLNKLDLMTSSGDEHFDKAVTEGTKRVSNFGPVPIYLQDTLREQGLVVELCPFKCAVWDE